ncbi:MAG: hypothetical protein HYX62_01350 [Gammaproteobacteria bacterium]|nr:hypothetical protein [Gammaproteobacteria bacterium]
MKRRYFILLVPVCLLAAANLWTWDGWSHPTVKEPSSHVLIGGFQVSDFQLKGMSVPSEAEAVFTRDLFYPLFEDAPASAEAAGATFDEHQGAVHVVKTDDMPVPSPMPQKTPEQLAEEAARDDLAKLRYVGVIFRAGQGHAFLLSVDQPYFVLSGDKVGNRFVVERITADSVELSDPATKVSGKIRISPGMNLNSNQERFDVEK